MDIIRYYFFYQSQQHSAPLAIVFFNFFCRSMVEQNHLSWNRKHDDIFRNKLE